MRSSFDHPIVDFHVHAYPDLGRRLLPEAAADRLQKLRGRLRDWVRPYSAGLHRAQTAIRLLPEPLRRPVDELAPLAPLPMLLLESTPGDLAAAMSRAGASRAVVIAHPPIITNEFTLELARENPALVAAVNIPPGTPRPGERLREYVGRGAKLLKIHPAADGEALESERYAELLGTADELGLPVILHTGCLHAHLIYRAPELSRVEHFAPWLERHPGVTFVLAHMNYHEPRAALDLGERFANVTVDTSWQPAEAIAEAVRRLGAERVLFGSDWPLAGDNLAVGIGRVRDCVESGFITEADAANVLGRNALRLLGIRGG